MDEVLEGELRSGQEKEGNGFDDLYTNQLNTITSIPPSHFSPTKTLLWIQFKKNQCIYSHLTHHIGLVSIRLWRETTVVVLTTSEDGGVQYHNSRPEQHQNKDRSDQVKET